MRSSLEKKNHLHGHGEDELLPQAPWKSLFNFTIKSHHLVLFFALFFAVASGIIVPALAIFLGKIFDFFSDYGAGALSREDLLSNVAQYSAYLVLLGAISWFLHALFLSSWLLFGELQAKSARDQLYSCMLEKEMEWFDMRKSGVSGLMPRLQRYVRQSLLYPAS